MKMGSGRIAPGQVFTPLMVWLPFEAMLLVVVLSLSILAFTSRPAPALVIGNLFVVAYLVRIAGMKGLKKTWLSSLVGLVLGNGLAIPLAWVFMGRPPATPPLFLLVCLTYVLGATGQIILEAVLQTIHSIRLIQEGPKESEVWPRDNDTPAKGNSQ